MKDRFFVQYFHQKCDDIKKVRGRKENEEGKSNADGRKGSEKLRVQTEKNRKLEKREDYAAES